MGCGNRSTSRPWRRPRSLTVRLSRPSLARMLRTMQAPARMTGARLACSPTISRRCVGVARAVELDLPIDLGAVQDGAVHDVAVVDRETVLDGGEVRDRAAHADDALDGAPIVQPREIGRDRVERLPSAWLRRRTRRGRTAPCSAPRRR